MARWADIETEIPDLAAAARGYFDAHVHKTIATLRRDGSPRISGIEMRFSGGDAWIGSMPRAVKAADLARDPRLAVHSGSDDPPAWKGDAKVAGRAVEVEGERLASLYAPLGEDPPKPGSAHIYVVDVDELVVTSLAADPPRLVIESWNPRRGYRRLERA